MTDAGYAWIEEHVSSDGYQPFGLGARLAEPRYIGPIIGGAIGDGLMVKGWPHRLCSTRSVSNLPSVSASFTRLPASTRVGG